MHTVVIFIVCGNTWRKIAVQTIVNFKVCGNTWNNIAVQTVVNLKVCGNTWNNTAVQTAVNLEVCGNMWSNTAVRQQAHLLCDEGIRGVTEQYGQMSCLLRSEFHHQMHVLLFWIMKNADH
jgi:hypothetical protein